MNRKLVFAAAGLCLAAAVVAAIAMATGAFERGKSPDENGLYTARGHRAEDLGEVAKESAARLDERRRQT